MVYVTSFLVTINGGQVFMVKYSNCRLIVENYVENNLHPSDSIVEFDSEEKMRQEMRRQRESENSNNTGSIMLSFEEL